MYISIRETYDGNKLLICVKGVKYEKKLLIGVNDSSDK